MFFRKFRRPRSRALREELEALCQRAQLEELRLPEHLRRDIGVDCGCLSG